MNRQCSAIKANGERCNGFAVDSRGYCWAHAPENAEQRRRNTSRAGRLKPNREIKKLQEKIKTLISAIESQEVEPTQGNSMLRGYSVLLDYLKFQKELTEQVEILSRLDELEAAYTETGGERRWG